MEKHTDIIVVLDRSGSMNSCVDSTIEGFNTFLKEQQKAGEDSRITLIQFDDQYQVIYEQLEIQKTPLLSSRTYKPRGMTALLDAIGRTIRSHADYVNALPIEQKPEKVILAVVTDGYENASQHYNRALIFKMIREMEEKHQWEVVFLGANQDAIHEAGTLGISAHKAMTFVNDAKGTLDVFSDLSFSVKMRHNRGEVAFSQEQKQKYRRKKENEDKG